MQDSKYVILKEEGTVMNELRSIEIEIEAVEANSRKYQDY